MSKTALLMLMVTFVAPAAAAAQKLVIVVRHAERADGGPVAGQMSGVQDPPLSAAGAARAARLATMLAESGAKAVFATEYRRTQETARPLATRLGLQVQTVPAKDMAGLIGRMKQQHAQDIVVVVAHSNTVPEIVKQFGGSPITVAEDEYDGMFLVVPATGATTKIKY